MRSRIAGARMVPGLEDMAALMLLNENVVIDQGRERIYFAGFDDAPFY